MKRKLQKTNLFYDNKKSSYGFNRLGRKYLLSDFVTTGSTIELNGRIHYEGRHPNGLTILLCINDDDIHIKVIR